MNYFSHYLTLPTFEQPYLTLGSILPDLLRDSKIDTSFFINKEYLQSNLSEDQINLSDGIRYHLVVDKYFHNSDFFKKHTKQIASAIRNSETIQVEKYTYFIAHILLELYIDYVLIKQQPHLLDDFYTTLSQVNDDVLIEYFKLYLPNHDYELFLQKKGKFVERRFLYEYEPVTRLGKIVSSVLKKVNIAELSQYDQAEIVNLVVQKFGIEIEQDIPILLNEIAQL